jgi:hypothetical protein
MDRDPIRGVYETILGVYVKGRIAIQFRGFCAK